MPKSQPFTLNYDDDAVKHLAGIDSKYHTLIRDAIEEQLPFEPEKETRNRKPLKRKLAFGAGWDFVWARTTVFACSIAWITTSM